MSGVALLDVNVLVALFDPDHVHHELAHDWFADTRHRGWATCPVTENGLVRVLSNPAYTGTTLRPKAVTGALARFCASGDHAFWPATLSLTDERIFDLSVASGHAQLTEVYLLGLATAMNGCLATFDRTIPVKAVLGATAAQLEVIGPGGDERGAPP
jgi:toxin-antitoxin system PIN domain toxin